MGVCEQKRAAPFGSGPLIEQFCFRLAPDDHHLELYLTPLLALA